MFSKSCIYGIRSVLYLTTQNDREFLSIKEISRILDISFHFLTKILQTLTQNGLIESFKGPRGGVRLAKSARDISLYDIITTIDGSDLFEQCILGLPGCQDDKPCPLHFSWKSQREEIANNFKKSDLGTLAEKIRKEDLRLYDINKNQSII